MDITIMDCEKHAEIGEFSVISDGKFVGFEKAKEEEGGKNERYPLLH